VPAPQPFWPSDGGPIYAETPLHIHDGQWLIEPWNAISSLLIVLPGLYFLYRLRGRLQGNLLLALCAPLLMLGGIGSTLFHALRSERALMMMDFLPTLAAFVLMIAYLWFRVLRSWVLAVGVLGLAFALTWWTGEHLPLAYRINVAYFIRGTAFFMPLLVLLIRTRMHRAIYMFAGLALLMAALAFRYFDKSLVDILPMGSHFLWHAATGLGGLCIAEYLLSLGGALREPPVPTVT
jgi:hypothetical protein